MLSGTGLRDRANGGYLRPSEIGISHALKSRIEAWLSDYEDAHHRQFGDPNRNERLDREGMAIAQLVRLELPNAKVGYFSNANMREIDIEREGSLESP